MSQPTTYFPLRWESTGDQWWYASPIDCAAANGHYHLVRELLRLDPNHLIKLTSLRRIRRLETVWDDDSDSQFHHVAKRRSQVARQLLVECETKRGKNSLIGAGYGGWLLYTAASAGDLIFVRELLDRDPLLVFGEGEYGVTDILYAAARGKDSTLFRTVLDFAAAPRFSTAPGTAAVAANEVPAGYKLEIMNRALHAAARGGNLELLKELLSECSDCALAYRDVRGATVLHAAAARGQVQVVKELASSEIVDSKDNQGNTALHIAAHRGHLPVVEALILASPSSIHAKNNAGETFLHSVVTGFQTPGFRRLDWQVTLLKHILSGKLFDVEEIINEQNNDGRTPLHLAISGNVHSDLVQLLMNVRCINVNLRDVDGMTPLDVLRQRPQSAISDLLARHLVSAGGIFSSRDYTARKAIASHIKRQSMGNSPGTSFRISDVEIFLYTGLENVSDGARSVATSVAMSNYSPEHSHHESSVETYNPSTKMKKLHSAADRLKRFIPWLKGKTKPVENAKKLPATTSPSEKSVVPLRERYSKTSSPASATHKRALSLQSNEPSPTANKKLASGLRHSSVRQRSRSNSFSKMSLSSQSSADGGHGESDSAVVRGHGQCDNGGRSSTQRHSSGGKKSMNQYLCFGGPCQHMETSYATDPQPYDVYERSVLTAA